MGRKSLAAERREAIMAAFERCIGRYGIDASLEQIADEAGVQRSLIRHYLGNRDALVDQMIARIATEYPPRIAAFLDLAVTNDSAGLIAAMFPDRSDATDWDNVILAVINTAPERYPQAKQRLAAMIEQITHAIAATLARLFPAAEPAARYQVAYGLLCLSQTHESLLWLGLDAHHTAAARTSAAQLIATLAPPTDR
jgi:AcrR family transcriptional regulator